MTIWFNFIEKNPLKSLATHLCYKPPLKIEKGEVVMEKPPLIGVFLVVSMYTGTPHPVGYSN
jgi:hypothetical protein